MTLRYFHRISARGGRRLMSSVSYTWSSLKIPARARRIPEPELIVLLLRRKGVIDLGKIGRIEIIDPEQVPAHIRGNMLISICARVE